MALSEHWLKGGDGALELADAVMDACNDKTAFKPLYSWDMPFKERIELVAREVYGADGVDFSAEASRKLADIGANVPAAATLTNTGGLPAFPFRTDDWDDVK